MPRTPAHPGLRLAMLQHRVPWNGLFWSLTAVLVGGAVFFAVSVHLRRAAMVVDRPAVIADGDPVKVVGVLNGDEILVEKARRRARVRMLGIRSFDPVVNEREITAFGRASVEFLEAWVLGRIVTLTFDEPVHDEQGRYLAYLRREGVDVNRRMVEEGISMVYTEFPFAREAAYLTVERMARKAHRGIWGGKKASLRIIGLRRDWATHRQRRFGETPPDYILGEAP